MNNARTPLRIVGVVAALLGLLFALQGLGIVGGSFMTGQRLWLFIGIVLVVLGILVASGGLFRRDSRRR
jgi:lipopolysaccharide export LptBFGC system permease protein LptF